MPFVYMMMSVLCWSLFPLVSAWGIEQLSIFDYILWTYVAGFGASAAVFFTLPKKNRESLPALKKVEPRVFVEIFIGCLCAILSFWCLLKSFSYVTKGSAAIVFEVWLIIAIYLAPLLMKKGWKQVYPRDMLFSLMAGVGIALLLVPQAREGLPAHLLLLPLIGGVFMSIASAMKPRAAQVLENKSFPIASLLKIQMLFSGGVILLAIPMAFIWPDKQSVYSLSSIAVILFTGIAIHTLGNLFYTFGMLRSARANVMVLWCLKPVFAVLWLWVAGQTPITPFTILGGIFIITASMMVTVRADRSLSYVATVVGILVAGAYTYFFRGIGMDDYYQAISVPLFFYAILVAFMMDRLIKSDSLEEHLAVEMVNYIDAHANKMGAAASAYIDHILAMVAADSLGRVDSHYRVLRNNPHRHLAAIHDKLDQLVLSKVRGTNFSEMFVIFVVGALTIVAALVFRPDTLVADGFAIVVPLSVIFIFFTLMDLSENRRQFDLERDKNGDMALSPRVTADLSRERVITTILIVLILAAFTGLLIAKHAIS